MASSGNYAAAQAFVEQHVSRSCAIKIMAANAVGQTERGNGYLLTGLGELNKMHPRVKAHIYLEHQGEHWGVTHIPERKSYSGGWREFVQDHTLVTGDVVVFELINSTTVKTYFFRHIDYLGGRRPARPARPYPDATAIDLGDRSLPVMMNRKRSMPAKAVEEQEEEEDARTKAPMPGKNRRYVALPGPLRSRVPPPVDDDDDDEAEEEEAEQEDMEDAEDEDEFHSPASSLSSYKSQQEGEDDDDGVKQCYRGGSQGRHDEEDEGEGVEDVVSSADEGEQEEEEEEGGSEGDAEDEDEEEQEEGEEGGNEGDEEGEDDSGSCSDEGSDEGEGEELDEPGSGYEDDARWYSGWREERGEERQEEEEDLTLPDAEHVAEYAEKHGPPPPCGPLGMDWWETREGEFCLETALRDFQEFKRDHDAIFQGRLHVMLSAALRRGREDEEEKKKNPHSTGCGAVWASCDSSDDESGSERESGSCDEYGLHDGYDDSGSSDDEEEQEGEEGDEDSSDDDDDEEEEDSSDDDEEEEEQEGEEDSSVEEDEGRHEE